MTTPTESDADFVARMEHSLKGSGYYPTGACVERLIALAADGLLLRKVVEQKLTIYPPIAPNLMWDVQRRNDPCIANTDLPTAIKQVVAQIEKEKV